MNETCEAYRRTLAESWPDPMPGGPGGHGAVCAACRAYRDSLLRLAEGMRTAAEPPDRLDRQVRAYARKRPVARWRWGWYAAAAAAVVLIAAGVRDGWRRPSPEPAPVRAAAATRAPVAPWAAPAWDDEETELAILELDVALTELEGRL